MLEENAKKEIKSVPCELQELDMWLSRLRDEVTKLEPAISPVLNAEVEAPGDPTSRATDYIPSCEVACAIKSHRCRVEDMTRLLTSINERIEL